MNRLAVYLWVALTVFSGIVGVTAPLAATDSDTPLPKLILISNVNIFDGKSDKLQRDMHVLVKDNLIETVSSEPLAVIQTDNVTMIDGRGRTLTPGFIDAHTHMSLIAPFEELENEYTAIYVGAAAGQMAEDMLMRGFTSVRDAGSASIGVQRAIDDGWFKGPRVFSSGAFITQTSGHLDMRDRTNTHHHFGGHQSHAEHVGHFYAVDGEEEMLAAARQNFRGGATQLKLATNGGISAIYSPLDIDQFTDDELNAASFVAESFGSYIMVHAYYDNAVSRAVDFGARSVEHGHFMTDEVMKKLAENDVYLVVEALMSQAAAPPSFTSDQAAKMAAMRSGFKAMIDRAKKHGVKIAFGSDVFLSKDAYALQSQEWIAREPFFTPYENLRAATGIGGEILALSGPRNRYREGPLGVIEEGAYADILLVDGNPLDDIKILADPENNIDLIMKDGVIYKNTL
jgi:imidazolonepropionase-like amidohydrolase